MKKLYTVLFILSLVLAAPAIRCMDDQIQRNESVSLATLPLEVTYRILKHCIDKKSLFNTCKNLTVFYTDRNFFSLFHNQQVCRHFSEKCANAFTNGDIYSLFGASLNNHYFALARIILNSNLITPDYKNEYGYTRLMIATYDYHLDIMHFLIEAGADIEAQNPHGDTALEIIARRPGWTKKSKTKAVKMLIHAGAHKERAKTLAKTVGNPNLFSTCTIL